jgi:hypothetical protein
MIPETNVLTPRAASDTIPPTPPFDWRAMAEMQVRTLLTQLNYWRGILGMRPIQNRCPNCKCELK